MNKWQYAAKFFTQEELGYPDTLNDLGKLGWELMALERTGIHEYVAIFKKAIASLRVKYGKA